MLYAPLPERLEYESILQPKEPGRFHFSITWHRAMRSQLGSKYDLPTILSSHQILHASTLLQNEAVRWPLPK